MEKVLLKYLSADTLWNLTRAGNIDAYYELIRRSED